ncbi:magnesium-protoporphyrin IX monomethyl ester anaerobic oxidative cyclase [Methylovulum psychrotolerans]|uniref:Magnesium-protoporphyrin IX monomethyl ester anaerobic oxidative cyclase n=1 Tax=Methylovulum psychrotolerans TaxID=1704499 RepID=A0A1Z4BYY6_9GAMM|nr:magnesium-protoporphyrin IX monomethyl ester anaerobic oxidative cyclase [Methylovulum psychrotolerans]ASF46495.1 magnesium-protoporphyrin IX monomethyl ester anaerobic oxidative cyclase [Methylovulum psychrotolerans]
MNSNPYKILLVNPPHTAIGSRIPKEQLPPLGLLSVGGPLLDAGFNVTLLDAEFGPLPLAAITGQIKAVQPDLLLMGHSGSTSAHETIMQIAALAKAALPAIQIIYGGVFPTYHWQDVLDGNPQIDYIVRGEGERTTVLLVQALLAKTDLETVKGIAFRKAGKTVGTPPAEMLKDLDAFRVGWELIDHSRYSYWGHRRAVVVQFSRGCPYLCSYCGQRGFWTQWRHRDPVKFAKELARLHREQGVQLINFADELPTGSKKAWRTFLEALIAEDVNLTLVGSTRAGDIVRDADILHLYKKAGVIRFLLGIEGYDAETLQTIKKGTTITEDKEAIRLLRQHGIISMATYVIGFEEETDRNYWRSLQFLLAYDPDQIQLVYVTPHRWTPYFPTVASRKVIQTDTRKWDYKHQVLATTQVPAWRVFLWAKTIELVMQARPKAILRLIFGYDAEFRHAMRWYTRMGRRVWLHEIKAFLCRIKPLADGPTLEEFWGTSLHKQEQALAKGHKKVAAQTNISL